jgi:hypothetical protein
MQSKTTGNVQTAAGDQARSAGLINNLKRTILKSGLALPWGPVTRRKLGRTVALYCALYVFAFAIQQYADSQRLQAMATGFMLPGAGFLYWASPTVSTWLAMLALAALSVAGFAVAMVLWFATGNIVAPVAVWLGSAVAAAFVPVFSANALPWTIVVEVLRFGVPIMILMAFVSKAERAEKQARQIARKTTIAPVACSPSAPVADELSLQDLQKMRALLDRALQPVDEFNGFDWIDQFQTASLRYQINFVSYALSVASRVHLPAAHGYMHEAQRRLALKLLDHRVWGYWQLENLWGNLRTSAEPVTRDNIMLSGFLSAQVGLARGLVGLNEFDAPDSMIFKKGEKHDFRYSLSQINNTIARHYANAEFGLLACEPNWVFPLCNAITATGLRAHDTQTGSSDWQSIAERFEESLHTEFTSANGLLVPFRSSRTGVAAPMIGGGAMQTLPCLFLNTVLPEIAAAQWQIARENLKEIAGRSPMWPVDIGNYRMNRSASYGACAAAAVEMGDRETADRILGYLDEDCPLVVNDGVAHRPLASLWAHALEFLAVAGSHNALQSATTEVKESAPVIAQIEYPDVLLASAKNTASGGLTAVMYPGMKAGKKTMVISGLVPGRVYRQRAGGRCDVVADHNGRAQFCVVVDGRTEFSLIPKGA